MPPFVGVAVKVTVAPVKEHTDVDEEDIETEGTTTAFTVIVIALLVAGLPVAQGVAFEVITTVTTWPFVRVVVVNMLLLVPALTPLTCH